MGWTGSTSRIIIGFFSHLCAPRLELVATSRHRCTEPRLKYTLRAPLRKRDENSNRVSRFLFPSSSSFIIYLFLFSFRHSVSAPFFPFAGISFTERKQRGGNENDLHGYAHYPGFAPSRPLGSWKILSRQRWSTVIEAEGCHWNELNAKW